MIDHEYTLLGGIRRAQVGRYLAIVAATISAAIVFILTSLVDIAKSIGISASITPSILSFISAGAVFAVLYYIFNCYIWKWTPISKVLKIPNLSGGWECEGQTLNTEGKIVYSWKAKITIVQSWDKIRVRLQTDKSGSNSNSAALMCDDADGYRLFYSYRNDPRIGEVELKSHRGFAEIVFNRKLESGEGEYFNGHGRFTFGTMKLKRVLGDGT